jgi:hypothetical protein
MLADVLVQIPLSTLLSWRGTIVRIKIKAGRHRILLAILGAVILAVIGYHVGTVWRTRVQTPMIVRAALESGRIELRAPDLSAWQKCALLAVQDPDVCKHRGV